MQGSFEPQTKMMSKKYSHLIFTLRFCMHIKPHSTVRYPPLVKWNRKGYFLIESSSGANIFTFDCTRASQKEH